MGWLIPESRDDRGRVVDALRASSLKGEDHDRVERRRLVKRLRAGVASAARRQWAPQLVVLVLVVSGCLGGGLLARFLGPMWMLFAIVLFCGAGSLVAREVTRRILAPQLSASAVAEGFCGSCAQSLRGLPLEEDGCVCCAECGAAWRRLRIVSPHWEKATEYERNVKFRSGGFLTDARAQEVIADDRGRFVRAASAWIWRLPKHTRRELGAAGKRRVRRAVRRVGRVKRIVGMCLISLLCFAPAVLLLATAPGGATGEYWAMVALPVLLGVVLSLVVWLSGMGAPELRARAMASEGVCGACGAMLDGSKPEADGCAVCANCHAAWRIAPPMATVAAGAAEAARP